MAVSLGNIKPFDGSNFTNWEFRLKLILEQNEVLEALEGSGDIQSAEFKKKDVKARSLIVQLLADNVLSNIKDKKTAKEIYEALESTYMRKGLAVQIELQKKLRNMKHMKGSLTDFVTEFEKTVVELRNSGGSINEGETITQLLAALPESYQAVATTLDVIYSQNPEEMSFDFVKNKLLQEELRQSNSTGGDLSNTSEISAFMNRRGRTHFGSRGRGRTSQLNTKSYFPFKCYKCGKQGHKRSECRERIGNSVNANITEEETEVAFMGTVEDTSDLSEVGSTNVSNVKNVEHQMLTFIIDSGATNHLITESTGKFLMEEKDVNIPINVAKRGVSVKAKRSGNLYVKTTQGINIKIKDVLLCEDLNYNLLSVKRLEQEGLKVLFENNKVKIIGDNSQVILEGYSKGNLYVVQFTIRDMYANLVSVNSDLLHRRMGHSSHYPAKTVCEICIKGKQTRRSFKTLPDERKARRILETVSSDVAGPFTPTTHDGMKYYVTFIDHFTHFAHVYLIKRKEEVIDKFKEYEAVVTAKFNLKISKLRCDNGGEYSSLEFKNFCKQKGIEIQYTIPHNPEQNGVSERFNRTIMNMTRCLLSESTLPKTFWGEAVRTSTYTINRLPSSALKNGIPAELWMGQKIDISNIRVFGSRGYVHIPKENRNKLDDHSTAMIMVGYTANGYRMWNSLSKKIITARSIIFEEEKKAQHLAENNNIPYFIEREIGNDVKEPDEDSQEEASVRRSTREKRVPKKLQEYELNDVPYESQDDCDNLMLALSIGFLPTENPSYFEDAIQDEDWEKAIKQELAMLEQNKTWEIVPYSNNQDVIDSKWIFTHKEIQGKTVQKARLVARGFQQKILSEEEIYTPVARMVTLRVLLSLAIERDYEIHQMDVKSAFLNGELTEPVYMYLPKGVNGNPNTHVCKLKKALYGLRSSPRCWYERLSKFLVNINFKRSNVDPCLFILNETYLLVWVDDLILVSNDLENIVCIKAQLSTEFAMKDLTDSNKITFLGLKIEIVDKNIFISQHSLIEKVLKRFNMLDCKESCIPMQPKLNLQIENVSNLKVPYKQLIGNLMYIMLGSRPDLCFSVMYFSQFQTKFGIEHWKHLKNVLRYLKHTRNFSLKYSKDDINLNVQAYVDSDFANNLNDRKSISGFVLKLNKNTVLWNCKKQTVVALSSSEAEYVAVSRCVTECIFLKQLLETMLDDKINCINVYEDNQSCIKMASTLETKRSKHIDVKHHFIKNYVSEGIIKLIYIPTNEQCADVMTKSLPRVKLEYFRDKLNVVQN